MSVLAMQCGMKEHTFRVLEREDSKAVILGSV
jgi:hypothetical protein